MGDDTKLIQQADTASERVTSLRSRARERKRLQRARARAPIVYERDDWRLFLDPATLPQKAGCQPHQLAALVLKELVDNALDEGANVTLNHDGTHWIVSDDGRGIDPYQVAALFAVNRPLRSSKLKRLPTRGMLGNGLRVGMAWARRLIVETHGQRLTIAVDDATGHTTIERRETVAPTLGVTVFVALADVRDDHLARATLALANCGAVYEGPSLPHWYGPRDMMRLMQAAPDYAMAADVIRDLGLAPLADLGRRRAHDLGQVEIAAMLREMQRQTKALQPDAIGRLGNVYTDCQGYARRAGIDIEQARQRPPFVQHRADRLFRTVLLIRDRPDRAMSSQHAGSLSADSATGAGDASCQHRMESSRREKAVVIIPNHGRAMATNPIVGAVCHSAGPIDPHDPR